jgi:integrase
MDADYISEVPVVAGNPPKDLTRAVRTVKRELAKYWDRDYVNQHIQSVNNHQHKMLLQFLWMSGVRITEAVSLKKQDLDFRTTP